MKSKAITNYIYNSFYQILTIILPLITAPYIARILGAEGTGIYSYTYSIAGYYVLFEMLGVKNYGSRCCAEVQDNKKELGKVFVNIYATQFLVSCVFIAIYVVYACNMAVYKTAALFQLFYVISGMADISWFFFGIEKFKMTTIRSTVIKLISIVLIFAFVKDANDTGIYICIISASMLASQVALWPFLKNEIEWCKPDWSEMKKHLVPNLVLFIPVVAVSLYKIMDKIMLGKISTMSQTGFYENAEKIINIPMSLITSLGTVMLPRMSNLAATGEVEKSKDIIHKSMVFVMLLGSAMTFGIMGIANSFVPLFYGDEFVECINVVVILAPTIFIISWANVIRTQYLLPNKMDKLYILTVYMGAVVNIILNLCFIPVYGAAGAAIGTLVAEVAVAVLQTFYVRKHLPVMLYMKEGALCICLGGGMYVGVKLLEKIPEISDIWTILLQIGIGGVLYCGILVLYLYKTKRELVRQFIGMLSRRGK